jgi:hypothetical protein
MRLSARLELSGWFKSIEQEPEPIDVSLRIHADLRALRRRELPVEGTLTAKGLVEHGGVLGELALRRLTLRFASDRGDPLLLRAVARRYREAPLFSLSVFDGHIERADGPSFDVQLRFDFRHDLPNVLQSLRLRYAPIP